MVTACSAARRSGGAETPDAGGPPVEAPFVYEVDFEAGPEGWMVGGTRPSWGLGAPGGEVVSRASSGERAWVTGLDGSPNEGEDSWIASPPLDLSGLRRPPNVAMGSPGVPANRGNPGATGAQFRFRVRPDPAFEGMGIDRVRVLEEHVDVAVLDHNTLPQRNVEDLDDVRIAAVNLGNVPAEVTVRWATPWGRGDRRERIDPAVLDPTAGTPVFRVDLFTGIPVPDDAAVGPGATASAVLVSSSPPDAYRGNDDWQIRISEDPDPVVASPDGEVLYAESFDAGPGGWLHYWFATQEPRFVWRDSGDSGELAASFDGAGATHSGEAGLTIVSPPIDLSMLELAAKPRLRVTLSSTLSEDDCVRSGSAFLRHCGPTTEPVAVEAPLIGEPPPYESPWSLDVYLDEGRARCEGEVVIHEVALLR